MVKYIQIEMQTRVIIFLLACTFTLIISCRATYNKQQVKGKDDSGIELILKKVQESSNGSFDCEVVIKNLRDQKIAIFDRPFFTTNQSVYIPWQLIVKYENSTQMYQQYKLYEFSEPKRSHYKVLGGKDSLNYSFTLNLKEFSDDLDKNEEELYYGTYYVHVIYHDTVHNHPKAIKNKLVSNAIKVEY